MNIAQQTPEITWHRVPNPDEGTDTNRILAWSKVDVGHELTGIFRGVLEGKHGSYGVLATVPDGTQAHFGWTKLLARRLSVVEVGQHIKIVFLGMRESKAGVPYATFDVFSKHPIMLPPRPADEPESDGAGDDDKVPF